MKVSLKSKNNPNIVILFLLFGLLCNQTFSQDFAEVRNTLESTSFAINNSGTWIPGKSINKSVSGSTYLFPAWNGIFNITTLDGKKTQLLNLNYNLKTKTLESFISNDSVFQYDIDKIDYIKQFNKKFKVIKNDELNGLYLELYESENVKLYKEIYLTIQEGVFNPLTQQKSGDDEYKQNFRYYLFINGKYEKIKLNKSDLLRFLNDKKEEIRQYANKENLYYNVEQDVVSLLKYYNSIKTTN